ncbi:MAG: DUF2752 domain-containing protein [Phycisphaeraceae bacterium JB051]
MDHQHATGTRMTLATTADIAPATTPQDTAAPQSRLKARVISLLVFVACLPLLGIAAWLDPDPAGMGTHVQLGLRPCTFEEATNLPCATCGMTTSFAHAAHGQLIQSFLVQPAGMLLCLLLAIFAILSLYTLIMGISITPLLQLLVKPKCFLLAGIIVGLAWGYKILLVYVGN